MPVLNQLGISCNLTSNAAVSAIQLTGPEGDHSVPEMYPIAVAKQPPMGVEREP